MKRKIIGIVTGVSDGRDRCWLDVATKLQIQEALIVQNPANHQHRS